jgi:serine/threonine protein kinase
MADIIYFIYIFNLVALKKLKKEITHVHEFKLFSDSNGFQRHNTRFPCCQQIYRNALFVPEFVHPKEKDIRHCPHCIPIYKEFLAELNQLLKLRNCRFIVPILGVSLERLDMRDKFSPMMIFEKLPCSVTDFMKKHVNLLLIDRLRILRDSKYCVRLYCLLNLYAVALGISHAHSKDVVHRDIRM